MVQQLSSALTQLGYSRNSVLDLSTVQTIVSDGVTNDRVALQTALDALSATGGGVALVPADARYRISGGDLIIPVNVTVQGAMWVGDYRPGLNWRNAPCAFVVDADSSILQRRNTLLSSVSVIGGALYDIGAINTVKKACDAVSNMAGIGVKIGNGATGDNIGNATGAACSNNLVVGFETCIESDGSSRIRIDGNRFDGQNGIRHIDVFDPASVFGNRGPEIVAPTYGGRLFTVTNASDNGSGEIRLTIVSATGSGIVATDMTTGQYVVASNVGGVPNASGVWPIVVIDASTIDLTGSVWAGSSFTSGGDVLPPIKWRRGAGLYLENCDGSIVTNNFTNNYTTGIVSKGNASSMIFGNYAEGYGYAHDDNIGLLVDEDIAGNVTARCMHATNAFSVYTHKVKVQKGSLNGFTGQATGSGTESIIVNDGETTFDGCIIEGSIAIGDNITRLNVVGGIMKGSVTGSAAALQKVVQMGGRSTAGVAGASGKQFDVYIRRASDGAEVLSMRLTEGRTKLFNLPTSSAGLAPGDVWNDGGTLKIVS